MFQPAYLVLELGDAVAKEFLLILRFLESFATIWHVDEFLEHSFGL